VLPFPRLVAARGRSLVGYDDAGRLVRELTLPELGASDPSAVPGGMLLAVVRLADLWTLAADGTLNRLTQSDSAEGAPAWSPGGRRLAFERLDAASGTLDVWTMNADTSDARNLTPGPLVGANPEWAPDGEYIAFERQLAIWTMRVDGTEARRVSGGVPGSEHGPAWSPDGLTIAFACGPAPGVDGICAVTAGGEDARNLTPRGVPGATAPVWSPDGTRLAFVASDGIWEVGANGEDLRRLVNDDRMTSLAWVRGLDADAG
jgi:Tol biopolymer transport system component